MTGGCPSEYSAVSAQRRRLALQESYNTPAEAPVSEGAPVRTILVEDEVGVWDTVRGRSENSVGQKRSRPPPPSGGPSPKERQGNPPLTCPSIASRFKRPPRVGRLGLYGFYGNPVTVHTSYCVKAHDPGW